MKKLIVLCAFILSSCVGAPKEELSKIHKIGVLSEVGNKADVVFVGTTVFTNGVATIELNNWDVDNSIEDMAIKSLAGKYNLLDLGSYRGRLSNKYNPNPSFGDGLFDYSNLAKELAKIGKENNLDAVIYISPNTGDFGAKYAHVLHTKDTFGLEGTMILSDIYGFLVSVEKGELLFSLNSYNLNVGTFGIGDDAISRASIVTDPNIAQIRPENVMSISPQQQESMRSAFNSNLAVVVPRLTQKLVTAY